MGLPEPALMQWGNACEERCIGNVSAGKSVGEIAWRRCEGIGSRGHVVGEKFVYFRLSEETEGEDESLSSGSSWLEVLCEWR